MRILDIMKDRYEKEFKINNDYYFKTSEGKNTQQAGTNEKCKQRQKFSGRRKC